MQLRWLDAKEVHELIDIPHVIEAVEGAFLAFGHGEAHMPSKVYLNVPKGDFRAMPDVKGGARVLLADANPEACERLAGKFPGVNRSTVSLEEAAAADIVTTLTPARAPFVQKEWIRPGAHINAMGADAPGKQEL